MAAPKKNKPLKKKPVAKNNASRKEKLVTVTPSGKKEDTFYDLVLQVVRQIPKGRVTSYGAIAACLGARSSSRMVGWALLGAKRIKHNVPAHRVVNRNGMLSGRHHFNPPALMQQLLEKEGTKVKDDKVVDFKTLFWDPAEALF
ncbi:MAG TPA: MGMT family protein [Chitinophagaceae bacterium]